MSENPDSPSRSSSPPSRSRRVAGIVSYVFAGYLAFVGVTETIVCGIAKLSPEPADIRRLETQSPFLALSLAVALGWAGYRLRKRAAGKTEWIALAIFLAIVLNGLLVFTILSIWG